MRNMHNNYQTFSLHKIKLTIGEGQLRLRCQQESREHDSANSRAERNVMNTHISNTESGPDSRTCAAALLSLHTHRVNHVQCCGRWGRGRWGRSCTANRR